MWVYLALVESGGEGGKISWKENPPEAIGPLVAPHLLSGIIPRLGRNMSIIAERITVNVDQWGGRPCIRGMRIRVTDVLDLLANGLALQQVLEEFPDLEAEDIQACLKFASSRVNHPMVTSSVD